MAGLYVYRSNRLEALGEQLAEVLRVPLANPLQTETIVVQSRGMHRWISFELATRLGVTMNCRFPFFQEFAQSLLRPEVGTENPYSRTALPWRVFSLLPHLVGRPEYEPLQRYAGGDSLSAQKQFQLAQQIGTVFDRYLAYSPERLLRWQSGEEAHWQANLWRELVRGYEDSHPPALLQQFIARVEAGATLAPGLAPRAAIFGISSVPPFYLHLLSAAGRMMDIHLFLLEPTDQYWGDLVTPREQQRMLSKLGAVGQTAPDLHLEVGNELLVSLGKPGRAFTREVQELQPLRAPEFFAEPAPTTLLRALQRDIFQTAEPAAAQEDGAPGERESIAAGDLSLQIHCCHGPMRELQVLHDRLLELFERLPGLMPKDILVTMPEVEAYAPFIEAVFSSPEEEAQRLPFSIADRSARAESSLARALWQLLELQGSRFGASQVLALLELKPIRDRFGIAESELDLLREWVDSSGICWGIDAEHREGLGLPRFEHNSWRAGLDRLLLGYALPGDGATLFGEVLPFPEIEGTLATLLGRFADFAEKLFRHLPALEGARTLPAWEEALRALLDTFVADNDEVADELKRVRQAVQQIGALAQYHPEPVPFAVLRSHLAGVLGETDSGFGFLAGHITFCSLKPMRSVPFRVICILGLNDAAFPRREPQLGFDLLVQEGRGRSRRDDDRQLFLENILSARDALLLSYSGLSPRDNSEAPPSVVVSELLDYARRNYRQAENDEPGLAILRHPLQPFSPRYFRAEEAALFSYSCETCAASLASRSPREPFRPRLPEPLPVEEVSLEIELGDLVAFFNHPPKYFVEQRLRVRLPEGAETQDDREPLRLDSLTRWTLQHRLAQSDGAIDLDDALRITRAEGVLPYGWFGRSEFEEVSGKVETLLAAADRHRQGQPTPPQSARIAVGPWHLQGTVPDLYPGGMVRVVAWELKAKNRLQAWILHLFQCAVAGPDAQPSRVFGTDRAVTFAPVPEASACLHDLLELMAEGRTQPLPFFPQVSYRMAQAVTEGKDQFRARDEWNKKESKDPFTILCFEDHPEPLNQEWIDLANRIYAPLLSDMEEEKI